MSHTGTARRWILGEPPVRGVAGGRLISRVGGEQQVEDEDWPVLLVHQLEVQVVGLVQTQAEVLPDEGSTKLAGVEVSSGLSGGGAAGT
jgi:hypothetical protein